MSRAAVGAIVVLLCSFLLAVAASAEHVSLCGTVARWHECTVFTPYWQTQYAALVLPDSIDVPYNTECSLSGDVTGLDCSCPGAPCLPILTNVHSGRCMAESLGCGVLRFNHGEDDCYIWSSLGQPDHLFLVDGLHGFSFGDTVFACGVRTMFPSFCMCCTVLLRPTLSECPITPVAGLSWGHLKRLYRGD